MAPVLLDTQAFLHIRMNHPALPERVRRLYADPAQMIYLSVASVWEITIKLSLKKLNISGRLRDFIESADRLAIQTLLITRDHVLGVEKLAFHHRDPFDRLLVAQCKFEKLDIVSADESFDDYGVRRIW